MSGLRVLDLYSGMGGLSLGIAVALKPREIVGLEIDKNAVMTYNLNLSRYNAKSFQQDVFEWKPDRYYDMVVGGSPCQPFSYANTKRKGDRHPLFPTLGRFFDIVLELEPQVFIHENVKGLLSPRHRHIYEEQVRRIKDRYIIVHGVLNGADYGVPQKRRRLFTIGIHSSLGKAPSLPTPTHAEKTVITIFGVVQKWLTLREAIQDIMNTESEIQTLSPRQVEQIKIRRQKAHDRGQLPFPDDLDKPARTISSDTIQGNKRETIVIPITEHVTTPTAGWVGHSSWRRLTVREALRVQGFPDWWAFPNGLSITTKFKLLGEAVPPILAYKIARSIAITMGWEWHPPTPEDFKLPYFERAFPELLATRR
jgi:DNA (cytosine-5)-methyltransferase 1